MATQTLSRTPTHLWIVGIVSLLWNCIGAVDYTMSETGNLAWFQMMGMGQEELAHVQSYPAWAVAVWAVGVWGSVLGSVLLLLRSRHAPTVYLISIAGAVIAFAYQFSVDKPASMEGPSAAVMPVVILILIAAQWYYARRMTAAGVLR